MQCGIAVMHDLGVRIVSALLLSGALSFVAFLLFSILYPRKTAGASSVSRVPSTSLLQSMSDTSHVVRISGVREQGEYHY
jgi:hypothetical protein